MYSRVQSGEKRISVHYLRNQSAEPYSSRLRTPTTSDAGIECDVDQRGRRCRYLMNVRDQQREAGYGCWQRDSWQRLKSRPPWHCRGNYQLHGSTNTQGKLPCEPVDVDFMSVNNHRLLRLHPSIHDKHYLQNHTSSGLRRGLHGKRRWLTSLLIVVSDL